MADVELLEDLALGADEAACVMGVQRSRTKRMHERDEIIAKVCEPVYSNSTRRARIFSLRSCEANFREYESRKLIKGRDGVMRPRAWLKNREPALHRLRSLTTRILFEDAIGTAEAAEVLMVGNTYINKLCQSGALVARKPATDQGKGLPRLWIISLASCEKFLRDTFENPPEFGRPRVNAADFQKARREFIQTKKSTHKDVEKRMRNRGIVRLKKQAVLESTGKLACEVCAFDFFKAFGPLGKNYAQAHHKVPLSVSAKDRESTPDDLAIVCANCHVMLHREDRKGRWRTVEELRLLRVSTNTRRSRNR